MSFIAIIPARMASTRLPGKPLMDLGGKPMVVRTAEQALRSGAARVIVATEDDAIHDSVAAHGMEAIMTQAGHSSGTDRLSEAVDRLGLADREIVVNIQGDEPLIDPDLVDAVAGVLATHPDAAMATCASPVSSAQALFSTDVVKVVCDLRDRALYFSRAPIPWARDFLSDGRRGLAPDLPALHHIGLYAYRVSFLRLFPRLPRGPLERFESLEQLRALENGHGIHVHRTASHPHAGVDTEADLLRVREVYSNRL